MIKTLGRAVIAGILRATMASGVAGMANTAATMLSTLILLIAFVELLPLLLIATATDESARHAKGPSSVVV
jgi:hypothetical protein